MRIIGRANLIKERARIIADRVTTSVCLKDNGSMNSNDSVIIKVSKRKRRRRSRIKMLKVFQDMIHVVTWSCDTNNIDNRYEVIVIGDNWFEDTRFRCHYCCRYSTDGCHSKKSCCLLDSRTLEIERPQDDPTSDKQRRTENLSSVDNRALHPRITLPQSRENIIGGQADKLLALKHNNKLEQKQQKKSQHVLSQAPIKTSISKQKAPSSSLKLDHPTNGLINWTLLVILVLLTPTRLVYSHDNNSNSQQVMVDLQKEQATNRKSSHELTLGKYPRSTNHDLSMLINHSTSLPNNAPESSPAPNLQFNQTLLINSATESTKNPLQKLNFGRDFGKRIQLNTSSSSSFDSLFARTILQLNALNNNPTTNLSEKSNNTLLDQQRQQKLQEQKVAINVDRRDYETIKLTNISQPQRRNFGVISNFFKYHSPNFSSPASSILKSNYSLLLNSLAKFTNRHLMNVTQSIGVSSGDNSTHLGKKSNPDLQQFIINPSNETLETHKSTILTNWIPGRINSQQPLSVATNLNQSNPEINSNSSLSLIVEPDFDLQANDTKDYHQVVALNTNFKVNLNTNDTNTNNRPNDLASFVQRQQMLASQASQMVPIKEKKPISRVIPVDWSASDIEQVIHSKKHDAIESGGSDLEGEKAKKETGKEDKRVMGEKLRDHEDLSHWKKEKHGHEEEAGEGKKGAKDGTNFIKDLGHNRHGWKNVYHKEEYAQHQKFHDIFRDKDWNDKKGKVDESYNYKKGQKFNDTQSKDYYDKDKHGTKYDYRKGDEWKRYEDDQYDKSNDEIAESNKDKKISDWELEGHQRQQQQQQPVKHEHDSEPEGVPSQNYDRGGHNHVSSLGIANNQQQVGDSDFGSDDAVIEQMKDKLDSLSEAKNPYAIGEENASYNQPIRASTSRDSKTTASNIHDIDYETEIPWNAQQRLEVPKTDTANIFSPSSKSSHQSVNEIVEVAKRANTKRGNKLNSNYQAAKNPSISSGSYRLNNHDAEDYDSDPDSEQQEKPMAKQENRKNELRLKLELDLGKSSIGQRSKHKRNQTKIFASSSNKPNDNNQVDESNGSNANRDKKSNTNQGWRPKDQASRLLTIVNSEKSNNDRHQANDYNKNLRHSYNRNQNLRQPNTKVGLPPINQSSDKTPVGWNWNKKQYNKFYKQPSINSKNISLSPPPLSNSLSQVLPSRPIFVKHLQMNGGIVLGKVNGLEANKTIQQQPSMPMLSEDLTVETSLSSPYGDMVTLSGLNHVPNMQNLQHPEPSEDDREIMFVFGDHQSAGDNSQQEQQMVISEPNVILEAASTMDEDRQPLIGDSLSIAQQQQTINQQQSNTDIENLMSQEQPIRLENMNFEPQQPLQQQSNQIMAGSKPKVGSVSKHPLVGLQENRLSNLLKFTALNYTNSLPNHDPSIGGGTVAPTTMQQAFNRLLRFPRVFGGISRPTKFKTLPEKPRWQPFAKSNFKPLMGLSVISTKLNQQQPQQQLQLPPKMYNNPTTPMENYNDMLAEAASKIVTTSVKNPFIITQSNYNEQLTNNLQPRLPVIFHNKNKLQNMNTNRTHVQRIKTIGRQVNKLDTNDKKQTIKRSRKKKSIKNSQPDYLEQYKEHQYDFVKSNGRLKSKPIRFESNYTALIQRPDKFIPIQQYWPPKIS